MSTIAVVTTTVDLEATARSIARQLVEQQLAACVQVDGPIRSHYRWKGTLETADEWRLMAKTTVESASRLADLITQLHPYELPELLYQELTTVRTDYADWVAEQVDDRHEIP